MYQRDLFRQENKFFIEVIYTLNAEYQVHFIAFRGVSSYICDRIWRGAGAVELATLERWYTRKGIVGSNPTLSAQKTN